MQKSRFVLTITIKLLWNFIHCWMISGWLSFLWWCHYNLLGLLQVSCLFYLFGWNEHFWEKIMTCCSSQPCHGSRFLEKKFSATYLSCSLLHLRLFSVSVDDILGRKWPKLSITCSQSICHFTKIKSCLDWWFQRYSRYEIPSDEYSNL